MLANQFALSKTTHAIKAVIPAYRTYTSRSHIVLFIGGKSMASCVIRIFLAMKEFVQITSRKCMVDLGSICMLLFHQHQQALTGQIIFIS